jgi:hypothetical protein
VAQLDATHPVDLARAVTALCGMGVRPRPALLERLLAMGPCPEFNLQLMTRLHQAITELLGDGGGEQGAGGKAAKRRPRQQRSTSSKTSRKAAGTAGGLEPPGEGAGAVAFDAYVDEARLYLGAGDAELSAAGAAGADAEVTREGRAAGASSLWKYVAAGDDGRDDLKAS